MRLFSGNNDILLINSIALCVLWQMCVTKANWNAAQKLYTSGIIISATILYFSSSNLMYLSQRVNNPEKLKLQFRKCVITNGNKNWLIFEALLAAISIAWPPFNVLNSGIFFNFNLRATYKYIFDI